MIESSHTVNAQDCLRRVRLKECARQVHEPICAVSAGPAACRSCSANCRARHFPTRRRRVSPALMPRTRPLSFKMAVSWDRRMASWTTFGRSPWATSPSAASNSFIPSSSSRHSFKYSFRVHASQPSAQPFPRFTQHRGKDVSVKAHCFEVGTLRPLVARRRGGPGDPDRGARRVWLAFLAQDPWTSTCEPHGSVLPFCKS